MTTTSLDRDGFLDGVTRDGATRRLAEADQMAATARLAATLVSKTTDRHYCPDGACRHRNHHRDAAYKTFLLDALGLPDEHAHADDYFSPLDWGVLTTGEADLMRGT
jgi:hypothetical protein